MESLVDNLKREVQCTLCKETLNDPKLAYCFHTFCKVCIKTNTQVDEGDINIFKCPQCDSQTLLNDLNDVEHLQPSPLHTKMLQVLEFVEREKFCSVFANHPRASWHCIDCNQSLCEECFSYHSKFAKNHQVVLLSNLNREHVEMIMVKKDNACKTHDEQDVQLYCKDCDVLICVRCWKDDHYTHKVTSLEQLIAIEKDFLSKDLEQIHKMNCNEKERKLLEQTALDIKVSGEKAKEKVKGVTNTLLKALRDTEQQLLSDIEKNVLKADRNLRIIRHTVQAQNYIKYFMENGTAREMINARQGEWNQCFTYNPFEENISGMDFTPNEDLFEQVKTGLGLVRSTYKDAHPEMSVMRVEPSEMQAMNKAKLVVELKTSRGSPMFASLENVNIQFTPQDHAKIEERQVLDNGQIAIDFVPRVCGELTVNVQVHGNDISNSPLVMAVKPQEIKKVDGHSRLQIALNTGSKDFRGVAVNKTNTKIGVVDWKSHCVRVFDMDGGLLLKYGSQGSAQGQLQYPDGLAFLNDTDLVIADSHNHRICIVSSTAGKLTKTFGCHGDGTGQFKCPCGVHVDDDSNIIVCDSSNNRVQVFTRDGDYLHQCNVPSPYSAVTHNRLLYVSNSDDSLVHVIDMKDNQSPITVTIIDGKDHTGSKLQWPFGLAIDNDNNLLVCDYSKCLVHKLTSDGLYIGRSSKQLARNPRYIALLNNSQLICTTQKGIISLDNK